MNTSPHLYSQAACKITKIIEISRSPLNSGLFNLFSYTCFVHKSLFSDLLIQMTWMTDVSSDPFSFTSPSICSWSGEKNAAIRSVGAEARSKNFSTTSTWAVIIIKHLWVTQHSQLTSRRVEIKEKGNNDDENLTATWLRIGPASTTDHHRLSSKVFF